MDEQISTTPEASVEQTTPSAEVSENQTTEQTVSEETTQTEVQSDAETVEEPDAQPDGTEIAEQPKNWEKIAKDNQASYTRVSQELAELKKQIEASKPKLVDNTGKISPEYREQYTLDIDNQEFLAFDQLSRRLDNEQRIEVENLLEEAKSLYNPRNKRAYEDKMLQVKDYFSSSIVEDIALRKKAYENQMESKFDELILKDKQAKAQNLAERVEALPDLKALIYQDSDNYSQPVMDIVKQLFDLTGDLDLDVTSNAIKSIKELGVKEYLAEQSLKTEKQKANVPSGSTVQEASNTSMPDVAELSKGGKVYLDAVKKYGMQKVDEYIMKGK